MKQRPILKKYGKKIEWSFLTGLLGIILLLGFIYGVNNTYNSSNKNIILPLNLPINVENFVYDNFWIRFNTYSVIMINIKDSNHLVTQNEIDQFQSKFFKDFGLKNNENIIERGGIPVNPKFLFCYMKFYDPTKNNELDIRKTCENKGIKWISK